MLPSNTLLSFKLGYLYEKNPLFLTNAHFDVNKGKISPAILIMGPLSFADAV